MTSTSQFSVTDVLGRVIRATDVLQVPERKDFLPQDLYHSVRAQAGSGVPLEFLPVTTLECYYPIKNGEIGFDKYSKRIYKIALFGILKSGEKVTVVLNDIKPYFEIRVPEGQTASRVLQRARDICEDERLDLDHTSTSEGLSFKKFDDRATFIQLHFKSTARRKKAIEIFRRHKFETAHDDLTNYYNVVCRDWMCSFTTWSVLRNYRVARNHPMFTTDLVFDVDMKDDNYTTYKGDIFQDVDLKNDRCVVAEWDIETCDRSEQISEIPQPENPMADMFLIGLSFTFTDSEIFPAVDPSDPHYQYPRPKGHLISYAITNIPEQFLKPMPNRCVIHVKDEKRMIQVMSILLGKMKPEYLIDFNGANYDMKWVIQRAIDHRILERFENNISLMRIDQLRLVEKEDPRYIYPSNWDSYAQWFPSVTMKLNAELNMDGRILKYPGFIHIDSMMQLRKLAGNPEKYGLNSFLDRYNVGAKVDMPYKRMFSIYELAMLIGKGSVDNFDLSAVPRRIMRNIPDAVELRGSGLLEWMRTNVSQVLEYCIVDGIRLQDLMVKTSFIRDKRQLGALSFVDMYSSTYRADGMKVRNITFAYARKRNLHISNIGPEEPEKGKYPGAYVFQPRKGLVAPRFSIDEMCKISEERPGENDEWRPVAQESYASTDEDSSDTDSESANPESDYDDCDVPAQKSEEECIEPVRVEKHYDNRTIRRMRAWIRRWGIRYMGVPDEAKRALKALPECFTEWLKSDHRYPVAGLDFSSLYPSIIMAFNMSPEKLVYTLKDMMHYRSLGWDTHAINFKFQGRDMKAWTIRHRYTDGCDMEDPEVNFGLFCSILLTLFNQRAQLKKEMKPYAARLEELEGLPKDEFRAAMLQPENQEAKFRYDYLNGKQKALKVLMNTFYGESGNSRSPLRVLEIAGGITSAAQEYIKKASAFIIAMGCRPYYGDTDSSYNSMPDATFEKLDRAYYGGRIHRVALEYLRTYRGRVDAAIAANAKAGAHELEEFEKLFDVYLTDGRIDPAKVYSSNPKELYYEFVIYESIAAIKVVNKAVNEYLAKESKGGFLKMAYEEFLYLCEFFGKKKYAGIAHEGGFNRRPKKIFIRGLELIKSGASNLLIKTDNAILWQLFNIHNTKSLMQLVQEQIHAIYTEEHQFDDFKRTAMYKPNKQNISVLNFVKRMERLGIAPEAMDRFTYVIVKKYPFKFDIKGRKSELSVGDRMEFADRALEQKMEIDLDYYMSGNIKGELARFISYHDDFHVEARDDTDTAVEEAEKKSIDKANKYITRYCERYTVKYASKGPLLKEVWKRTNGVFQQHFQNVTQCTLLDIYLKPQKGKRGSTENDRFRALQVDVFTNMVDKARDEAQRDSKNTAVEFMKQPGYNRMSEDSLLALKRIYKQIVEDRKQLHQRCQPHILAHLRLQVNALNSLMTKRDRIMEDCITSVVGGMGVPDDIQDDEQVKTYKQNFKDMSQDVLDRSVLLNITQHIGREDLQTVEHVNKSYLELYAANKLVYDAQSILERVDMMCRVKLGDVTGVSRMANLSDVNDFIAQNFND